MISCHQESDNNTTNKKICNIAISGGLFPPMFNIQLHGSPCTAVYRTTSGIRYGLSDGFHGSQDHDIHQQPSETFFFLI